MRELTQMEAICVAGGDDNPAQAIAGGSLIAGGFAGGGIVGGTGAAAAGAGSVGCIPPVGLGILVGTGGYLVGNYLEDAHGVGTAIGETAHSIWAWYDYYVAWH